MGLIMKVVIASIAASVVASSATSIICKNGEKIRGTFCKNKSRKRSK